MLAGLVLMPFLPVKLVPSQTLSEMSVSFNISGNAARVVEMGASSKLEAMFDRIKGVESICRFIPFMIGQNKEDFWVPLAAGTIGRLVVSIFGTFCFLPLFMGVAKSVKS